MAGLEKHLNREGMKLDLIFVNATPDIHLGYNSLASQAERVDMFDRFLEGSTAQVQPDAIAIACNTLSVLYDKTRFAKTNTVPVYSIVEAGVELSKQYLADHDDDGFIIFGTETTIEAGTYAQRIGSALKKPPISQACPNLASSISADPSGQACRELLRGYAAEALNAFDTPPESAAALLACTHYGYQRSVFEDVLKSQGIDTTILNPNDLMVSRLIEELDLEPDMEKGELAIRCMSRFQIPENEVDSMTQYLQEGSPLTLAALSELQVISDLFVLP